MKTLILSLFVLFSAPLFSQENWVDLISSSDNLYEIQSKAKEFFDQRGTGKGSGYKQYMRWMGQAQLRVNGDGRIQNTSVLNYKGLKERQKNFKSTSRSTNGDWENLGPFDYTGGDVYSGGGLGRINCMAFHPTDPNTFYAGSPMGGLWKTEDNGNMWEPLTDGLPSLGVTEVIIHPTNPNIIYMLTGDGDGFDVPGVGVLKSYDGGIHWEETDYTFDLDQLNRPYRMVMHPENANHMLIGLANNGIVRTSNGFISKSTVLTGVTVWDIEYAPNHPDTVYAATSNGLYTSINGGFSWTNNPIPGLPIFPANGYPRSAIAISPSAESSVYVVYAGVNGPGLFNGVFKSQDFGATFTMQSNSPNILGWSTNGSDSTNQAWYDLTIIVHPEDDATVFVGAVNMWKSNDSGATWGRETWSTKNFEPLDPYVHADWHNMYYQGEYLYACVDGGISRSNDEGNDWSEISKNLCIMQFYEIALNDNQYMGGAQDNGVNRTEFTNPSGHNILGGDGFGCTWHYGNTSIQYMSNQGKIARRQGESNVYIWEDSNAFWFNDIKMHTTNPDYIFIIRENQIYRGNQDVAIWNFHWDSLGTAAFLPLFNGSGREIFGYSQGSGANDNVMYVLGTGNVILKTTNLSATLPSWTIISDPTTGTAMLSDIIQSPTDPNKVWITCGGYTSNSKVWYSNDGGSSWTNITDNIPNVPVTSITYEEGSSDAIYIGTSVGAFYRSSSMTDWSYFGNGLPNVQINDLEVHDGYLYAGTFGRGMWRTEVFSPCPYSLSLTQANDPMHPGIEVHHVSNHLTSSRIIDNNMFKDVTYTTENYINLLPGFHAKVGSSFVSAVDDCPD